MSLKAFSIRRQVAAQALGNRVLSGQKTSFVDDRLYDGMFADAINLVYLMQCEESDVHLASRKPEIVATKAMEWAENEGISISSPLFAEINRIYGEVLSELFEAQFEVTETSSGSGSKNV